MGQRYWKQKAWQSTRTPAPSCAEGRAMRGKPGTYFSSFYSAAISGSQNWRIIWAVKDLWRSVAQCPDQSRFRFKVIFRPSGPCSTEFLFPPKMETSHPLWASLLVLQCSHEKEALPYVQKEFPLLQLGAHFIFFCCVLLLNSPPLGS